MDDVTSSLGKAFEWELSSSKASKAEAELEQLEKQIKTKLNSNEPIDTDYWEHLLKSLLTYKAKAKLSNISRSVLEMKTKSLRKQQALEADALKQRLSARLSSSSNSILTQEPGLNLDPEILSMVVQAASGETCDSHATLAVPEDAHIDEDLCSLSLI